MILEGNWTVRLHPDVRNDPAYAPLHGRSLFLDEGTSVYMRQYRNTETW